MNKVVISSLIFIVVAIFAAPSVHASHSNIIGRWGLNENTNSIAKDTSGHNLSGIISGSGLISGKFGNALNFNQNSYVQVPNNSLLEPQTITIETWVRRSGSPGTFNYIASKGASGCNTASYALYTGASGGLQFYISNGNTFELSPDAGTGVWDGNWHHATGTYDGANVRLYVDGLEVGTGTPTNINISYNLPDSNDLYIGRYVGTTNTNSSAVLPSGTP